MPRILPEQVRGPFDLEVHGAIRNLRANDGLKERQGLVMAALLEHQLRERHAGPA